MACICCGVGANCEHPARDQRVNRFDTAIQHFGEARNFRNITNRNTLFPEQGGRASRRDKFDSELVQTLGKSGDTGLISDTKKRAKNSGHGKGLF